MSEKEERKKKFGHFFLKWDPVNYLSKNKWRVIQVLSTTDYLYLIHNKNFRSYRSLSMPYGCDVLVSKARVRGVSAGL